MIARLLAIVIGFSWASQAGAACLPSEITGISYSSTSLSPYNPFVSFAPKLVTIQVSATRSCTVELALYSPTLPARMTGPDVLAYDVRSQAGGNSVLYSGGIPSGTVVLDIGAGNIGSGVVQIHVPANQIVSDGAYIDNALAIHVFDRVGASFTLLKAAAMPINGTVAKVCQFGVSSTPTLNFSPGISNGVPNPAYVRSVTFDSLSCTAPSIIRLSGGPLQIGQAGNAPAGLDNQIHFRASASFAAASTVLDTRLAPEASSLTRNTVSGAVVNGIVSIDVNLLAGNPLVAGAYSGLLTVTIDPNF